MKKLTILFAMTVFAMLGYAQNNGKGNGNNNAHIASIKVSEGFGDLEVIEIKLTRPAQNYISNIYLDLPGTRISDLPMTKVSSDYSDANGNSGNNANEIWVVSVDLGPFKDSNGMVEVAFLFSCCHPMIIRQLPGGK